MSIFGGLRSGVSGLFSQSQSMAMISDNIANVNTVGYKVNRPRFSTLVTTQASDTLFASGGVQSSVGREIDQQGLLAASSASTDIAISGKGFFAVTDQVTLNTTTGVYEPTGDIFYTRAGEFRADSDGNLVNSGGFFLMGFPRNSADTGFDVTNVLTALNGVNVASQSASPVASSTVTLSANLQSATTTGGTFDTSIQIFDRQGAQRTLTLSFAKTDTVNVWDISGQLDSSSFLDATGANGSIDLTGVADGDTVVINGVTFEFDDNGATTTGNTAVTFTTGSAASAVTNLVNVINASTDPRIANLTPANGGTAITFAEAVGMTLAENIAAGGTVTAPSTSAISNFAGRLGQVTFNSDGTLASLTATDTDLATVNGGNLSLTLDHDNNSATTADQVAITLDFGTVNGSDGLTQFSGTSVINDITQNGKQFGSLSSVSVNEEGIVTALFDNGEQRQLFQVPLVTFNNPNGLSPRTGNVFAQTDDSGQAVVKVANTGGAGLIASSSLEQSTVDLADEFTRLIVTQRAFAANTRIITTADEMLDELIRAKR